MHKKRLWLGLSLPLLLCGQQTHLQADPPSAPNTRSTPTAGSQATAPFDVAALAPFFQEGPLAQATGRLRAGDAQAAVSLLASLKDQTPAAQPHNPERDRRVEFLLAVAQLRSAQALPKGPERQTLAKQAAGHFDALQKSYPLLSSYHALFGAKAHLLAGQPALAQQRADLIPAADVLDCDARFVRSEALRELTQKTDRKTAERAVQAYRSYLSACGSSGADRRFLAQQHQAELLDEQGRTSESLPLWRRLYIEAPTENFGALASKRLEQPGTKSPAFSPAELLERAQVLFEEMRNPESEAAFRWVLEQPDLEDAQRCTAKYHLAQSVFKQRQRPRAAPLFDEAAVACGPQAAKNDDLHMKSLYQAARCHASGGELQKAADLFAAAEAAHPAHSYADDSRVRQAEMYVDLADKLVRDGAKKTCQADSCPDYEAKSAALLADLPERYPDGDRRAEALWRLAFRAYRKKNLPAAQTFLEDALKRIPHETGWDQEGRTLYWLGRLRELQQDTTQAVDYYRRTCTEYPLSFYTLLALNRLRVGYATAYEQELTELQATIPASDEPMQFVPRALFLQPGFGRGLELLRLGMGSEARREFSAVGITVPDSKTFVVSGPKVQEQTELLWLASTLYDRAGAWNLSHFIPRHILTDWQRSYPIGELRKKWLLAFPRGYGELLQAAAAQNGQPEALQLAIVREESAFDPLTESFANAIGLTQMIPSTAKRFSQGLPHDRQALRDPATNVAIGSHFLGFLWKTFQGNPALAIAGYNAGEGAVWRWLRTNADLVEIDAFIEAIPYDETRGYTKRVLSSFLTYSWLWPQKAAAAAQDGVGTKPADKRPSLVPILPFPLPPPPAAARKASVADQSPASPVAAPAAPPAASQVEPSATAAASTDAADTAKPAAPARPPAAAKSLE